MLAETAAQLGLMGSADSVRCSRTTLADRVSRRPLRDFVMGRF